METIVTEQIQDKPGPPAGSLAAEPASSSPSGTVAIHYPLIFMEH